MSLDQLRQAASGDKAARPETDYDRLRRQLENNKGEFVKLLGTQQNADAFIRVVLNAVLANPGLLEVANTPDGLRSLIAGSMKAAQDGLMLDGREAVLNVYNSKITDGYGQNKTERWVKIAQYLPMVGGLVKKLYASGEVTYIDAACVYAGDTFTWRRGENPLLEHEPTPADDPGEIIAAYAVVKLKNGEVKREVMYRRDIEAVRKASKAVDREGKPTGPWKDWYDQQSIKSVLKRINKQLPKSDAFERLADYDNEVMHNTGPSIGALTAPPGPTAPPQPAAGALEHDPSPSLPQDIPQGEPQGSPLGEDQHQDGGQRQSGEPVKLTFDVLEKRLRETNDKEIAALVLDEGRGVLTDDENKRLGAIYSDLYEPAGAPPAPAPASKKK